ncbi:MAG: hypothetical protein J6252_05160 [Clostridia bacterium]|nr:hypothetical protein [Clostridia bacterium]
MICLSGCGGSNTVPTADSASQTEAASQRAGEQNTPGATSRETADTPADSKSEETEEKPDMKKLTMKIGSKTVAVDWEENESVAALAELVQEKPLTIQMSMYGGFEQVGPLGTSLPRNDVQTTTQAGDIVLYSGNQIVVFYGSNSWAYTRLGRIKDMNDTELRELLDRSAVELTVSVE